MKKYIEFGREYDVVWARDNESASTIEKALKLRGFQKVSTPMEPMAGAHPQGPWDETRYLHIQTDEHGNRLLPDTIHFITCQTKPLNQPEIIGASSNWNVANKVIDALSVAHPGWIFNKEEKGQPE